MLPEQKTILQLKYAAKPFASLTTDEQEAHSLALMLKINIVTGWATPKSETEENILAEQLKLYLVENWPLYNVDEIMYAMRSYATSINNWGKNMNLNLIGQVLNQYCDERIEISKVEESKPQTTNLLPMAADWKPLCEAYYQNYLKDKFHIHIMPVQLYDEFVSSGFIEDGAHEDYLFFSKAMLISKFKLEKSEASNNELVELNNKINSLKAGESKEMITDFAKKLTVEFLYKTAKEKGFKNLFAKS